MSAPEEDAGTLVVRRLIPVPREQVFEAWLDPASLTQWMQPGDVTHVTAQVDARVGGTFRIVMTHGRGDAEHWGEYLTIEPPSLLSFTWISASTLNQPSVVSVQFLERGTGTELILTHRRLPPDKVEVHRKGWSEIVEKLDMELARRP